MSTHEKIEESVCKQWIGKYNRDIAGNGVFLLIRAKWFSCEELSPMKSAKIIEKTANRWQERN
jgi:hypothetical protein